MKWIINLLFISLVQSSQLTQYIYKKGNVYNLGYTLVAIATLESQLGKYPINLEDPSCGLYHNLLPSVANRLHITPNKWNQSRLCERLIKDKEFATDMALQELLYWRAYWKSRGLKGNLLWVYTVGSYNGGNKPNMKYVRKISKIIKRLKHGNRRYH